MARNIGYWCPWLLIIGIGIRRRIIGVGPGGKKHIGWPLEHTHTQINTQRALSCPSWLKSSVIFFS